MSMRIQATILIIFLTIDVAKISTRSTQSAEIFYKTVWYQK